MAKNQQNRMSDLLASVNADLLGDTPQHFEDNTLRIERILLEMVRPDPVQPRRVLPERIHFAFHSQQLTPTQALRELVQIAQVAARQNGRPFSNVLELLPNADDEKEEEAQPVKLSPEEILLRDLVNLAVTIRDDGQVNPITVVDVTQGVTRLYRIETGERRYWATWLLRDFMPGYTGDGMIPCNVIAAPESSIFRQAKENTSRTGLSAIAMARQAALLLLTVHGYEIPNYPVDNDFYRQALNLDLRGKREFTERILSAMGGVNKVTFRRYKSLLKLSDGAMELADRYQVDEGKLRHVVTNFSPDDHEEVVRQIIDFNLTSKQVEELSKEDVDDKITPEEKELKRVLKSLHSTAETTGDDIVKALLRSEKDIFAARAVVQRAKRALDDADQKLGNA